jgi:hypothetical protein
MSIYVEKKKIQEQGKINRIMGAFNTPPIAKRLLVIGY